MIVAPWALACTAPRLAGDRFPTAVSRCEAGGLTEHDLRTDDGLFLYIQPAAISASGDEVLVAGALNHAHRLTPRPERVPMDSLFGAIVSRDGSARIVASPIGSAPIWGPHALPRPGGGWDVVFAEVRDSRSAPLDSVVKLWHGVLHGGRWGSVSEIPLPPSLWLRGRGATELVRAGDTLIWGLPAQPGFRRTAVIARHVAGTWRSETRTIGSASYIAMAHHRRHGTILAVVRGPPPGGSGGAMSLYLEPLSGDAFGGELLDAGELEVHHPSMIATEEGFLVAWKAESGDGTRRVVARDVNPGSRPSPGRVVEATTSPFRPVVVLGHGSRPRWVVEHVRGDAESPEVRILEGTAANATEVARFDDPYDRGRFVATASDAGELILSGRIFRDGIVLSRLQRIRLDCSGAQGGR